MGGSVKATEKSNNAGGKKGKALIVKVERMKEGLKDLSIQERRVSNQEVLIKWILSLDTLREPQH
jgi:hypothetical protein